MKNFRVFKTVKTKRIILRFWVKNLGVILLFLMLFPYFTAIMFGNLQEESSVNADMEEQLTSGRYVVNNRTDKGMESIPMEIYVADKLARCMGQSSEMEALKAQAVLIRTGLFWQMCQVHKGDYWEENKNYITADERDVMVEIEDPDYGSVVIPETIYMAVAETAGLCVIYEEEPIVGAYFAVSSGVTRTGTDLGLNEYPYLKGVICGRDFLSEEYSSSLELKEDEFDKIWDSIAEAQKEVIGGEKTAVLKEMADSEEITYKRDDAGYVLYLEYREKWVSGESFRRAYNLASSCFFVNKEKGKVTIDVKGKGHGMGMSLYGAEQLAETGSSCVEILEYFFDDVTIAKIE